VLPAVVEAVFHNYKVQLSVAWHANLVVSQCPTQQRRLVAVEQAQKVRDMMSKLARAATHASWLSQKASCLLDAIMCR
jgi:hypothetical protein